MAQRKKLHEEIAENLKAQRDGSTPEDAAENDLEKREVQQRIMHPDGTRLDLSGGPVTLYPFSLEYEARAYGLCSAVMADAYGAGARSMVEVGFRIAAILLRPNGTSYKNELLALAAIASGRPGVMDEEKSAPIIAELLKKCKPKDYVDLFKAVFELSGMKDTPKPLGE